MIAPGIIKVVKYLIRIKLIGTLFLYSIVISGASWTGINTPESSPARINLIFSDKSTSIIRFTLDGFILNDVNLPRGNASYVSIDNSTPLLMAGCPDLVKITSSVIIPDIDEMAINIISSHYSDYENIEIAPSMGDLSRNLNPKELPCHYGDVYSQDDFFPGSLAGISDPYIVRDYRGLTIIAYPFHYNPVKKILRVYDEITVQIVTTGRKGKNPLIRDTEPKVIQSEFQSIYNHHFINTEFVNNARYTPVEEEGNMLIISYGPFIKAMASFVEWKKTIGIPAEIVDIASIGDAIAIKAFVENYYSTKGLAYLLLVGDAQQVPSYISENGISDISYGYVVGQDHYPDLFVGRFSAEDPAQVAIQVEKTINYERNPDMSGDWLKKSIGIGSDMGPGDDYEIDFQHVRNMQNDLLNYHYISSYELFDGSQGNNDQAGNPTWKMLSDRIEEGAGLIIYTGVSSSTAWSTTNFNNDHINSLTNSGRLPFIISVGCWSGDFVDHTCMAEMWLRASKAAKPTGAVATFMPTTDQSWWPPMAAQDEMIDILVESYKDNLKRTFGGITMNGCMAMNDRYNIFGYKNTDTWVLFGDPSLQLRTDTPGTIEVTYPDEVGWDQSQLVVSTSVNEGIVTISSPIGIIGSNQIENGTAVIFFNNVLQSDTVTICVTSYNKIPFIGQVPVVKHPGSAYNPSPENHRKMVSSFTTLNWEKGYGACPDYYKIYFGTDYPPSDIVNGQITTDTCFIPEEILNYQQEYYWKIDAVNNNGIATGDIWEFTVNRAPDETFENTSFIRGRWNFNGITSWQIDDSEAHSGQFAARSGNISDGQFSSLLYIYHAVDYDYVGFWSKVSSEENKDKLQFMIDGQVKAEYSGQIGWTEHSYPVPQGTHSLEWKYIKDNEGSAGSDCVWIDDLYLPNNGKITVFAGQDDTICAERNYVLAGSAQNYTDVLWTTSGTGYFSDNRILNAVYIPGSSDIIKGSVKLSLEVTNTLAEIIIVDEMVLDFKALPNISQLHDTLLNGGESITLNAYSDDITDYLWLPSQQKTSNIYVDSTGLGLGIHNIKLYVTGSNGCFNQKTLNITFKSISDNENIILSVYPNPNHGVFYYKLSSEKDGRVRNTVYDIYGRIIIDSQDITIEKSYTGVMDLSILPKGVYIMKAERSGNSAVQEIIVL